MNGKFYSYLRYSTPIQEIGDSHRRQIQSAEEWCKKHNFILERTRYEDLGKSGYKGEHLEEGGGLKKILEAIKNEEIEAGDTIILENLDRLSRQGIFDAMSVMLTILKSKVRIVTLSDEKMYDENASHADIIMSILLFSNAHEESKKKSYRLKSVWEQKRKEAIDNKKPQTKICPAWLKLENGKYIISKENSKVVLRIIGDYEKGLSFNRITRNLNDEGVKTLSSKEFIDGRETKWWDSYLKKIMSNPALYGTYEIHKLVGKKRVKTGETIEGYFPALIDKERFYNIQQQKKRKAITRRGNPSPKVGNIFRGLVKCGYCSGSMIYKDSGNTSKSGRKGLVCSNSIRREKTKCPYVLYPIDDFEVSFFCFVGEVNLNEVLLEGKQKKRIMSKEINLMKHKYEEKENAINAMLSLIGSGDIDSMMPIEVKRYRELREELSLLDLKIKELENSYSHQFNDSDISLDKRLEETKSLMDKMYSDNLKERVDARIDAQNRIGEVVSKIEVYGGGVLCDDDELRKIKYGLKDLGYDELANKTDEVNLSHLRKSDLCFRVYFRTGGSLVVSPRDSAPQHYHFVYSPEAEDSVDKLCSRKIRNSIKISLLKLLLY
jgi:DNA invertase Pin-like site-specific DNA recombinase